MRREWVRAQPGEVDEQMESHEHDLLDVPVSLLELIEFLVEHQQLTLTVVIFLSKPIDNLLKVLQAPLEPEDVSLAVLVAALTATRAWLVVFSLGWHDTQTSAAGRHYRVR